MLRWESRPGWPTLQVQSIVPTITGELLQRVRLPRLPSHLRRALRIFLFRPPCPSIRVEVLVQVSSFGVQCRFHVLNFSSLSNVVVSIAEEEAASSTTQTEVPPRIPPRIPPDPSCWTSENVISYIAYYYPLIDSKGDLCELFRQHVSKKLNLQIHWTRTVLYQSAAHENSAEKVFFVVSDR